MPKEHPVVFVIDDDESIRMGLKNLLESVGIVADAFVSAEEFIRSGSHNSPGCLILDVKLPGMSGLDLQEVLEKLGVKIPIIFITAHGDVPMVRRALKSGAIEFLTKPVQKEELLGAVHQALVRDHEIRVEQARISALQTRFEQLTLREREVMDLIVTGMPNKLVADKLGLSEVTVKLHRARVMQKMEADSLANLIRMSDQLKDRKIS